jgi:hypothetical protein
MGIGLQYKIRIRLLKMHDYVEYEDLTTRKYTVFRHVVRHKSTDVSEDSTASISKVEE